MLDTKGESSPESVNESTSTKRPHASSDVNEGDVRQIMKPSHGDDEIMQKKIGKHAC